jgi:hypothetical protein
MLTKLFLRIFAMNLRRGWRSGSGIAWSDAIFTVDILICLPLLCLLGTLWLLAIDLFPSTVGLFGMPWGAEAALVVATWLGVDIPLSRKMGAYKREPISSTCFNSTADRFMMVAAGAISSISCALLVAASMFLHKLF